MRFKYKAKLFKVVMFISGALTLVACDFFGKVDELSSSSDPSNPDDPSTPSDPSNPDDPSTPSDPSNTDDPMDPEEEDIIARENVQIVIESLLKDKLNERFEENVVSTIEAHTFTLKDSVESGKALETSGYVILADDEEAKPVTLDLPVSLAQYTNLYDLGFNAECDAQKQLSENYTLEQLNFADTIISNENLTYNYATLNGNVWDLDAATPAKIEKKLEKYFEQKIQQYFLENYNNKYFDKVDLKNVTVETNLYNTYQNCIAIHGNLNYIANSTSMPLVVIVTPSSTNFNKVSNALSTFTDDENKNMAENYNLDFMNLMDEVVNDNTSKVNGYSINNRTYAYTEI